MKYIRLTQDKQAIVDDDMFEYLSQWKWIAAEAKNLWYAQRNIYKPKIKTMLISL